MSRAWSTRHVRREQEKLEKRRLRGISEYIKAGPDRARSVRREPDASQSCPVNGQDDHELKSSKFYIKQKIVKKKGSWLTEV